MKLSILAIFTLILCSCGRSPTGRGPASSLLGSEKLETSNLNGLQKTIATNLCYDLKAKDMNWRSNLLGQNFVFDVEEQICGELPMAVRTVSTTLKGPINSDPMRFDPNIGSGDLLNTYVVTDAHGAIASICSKLFVGQNASNTMSNGNEIMQFVFHQKSVKGYDGFTVLYFKADSTQAYKEVVTEIDLTDGPRKGMEKEIRYNETCADGGTASNTQTYIP